MRRIALLFLVVAGAWAVAAQEIGTKVSVHAIGDYYWVVSHHDEALEDRNGFWMRRVFLTVDKTIDKSISARFRLEANSPGDFKSSTNMQPFVKDAWLRWQRSDAFSLIVGLSPDPMVQSSEDFWGYRSLEKTPLDLYRLANTRDLGVAASGRINPTVRYHVMVGNGAGTGGEVDSGKALSVIVGFDLTPAVAIEISGEHNDTAGERRTTAQLVGGVKVGKSRFGAMLVHQDRNDTNIDIATLFGVVNITPKAVAVLRVDRLFDPIPDGPSIAYLPLDPNSKATVVIAGCDLKLHAHFGLMPNVEFVSYDGQPGSSAPSSDVIPRLTFYATF